MKTRNMISFDWAMKRLLRNKANFEVLEGFLSELLHRKIIIKHIAESEGNKEKEDDKSNKVDILVEADDKELVIIELQYYGEDDYFKRMLYGVSKSITEHVFKGDTFSKVRKVYSVSIVYFELGLGDDYVYHGFTEFKGLHTRNELKLSERQKQLYAKTIVGDLYPEYYIIKVNGFDLAAKDRLDEWIYYLRTGNIRDDFTAQGLDKAREILAFDNLTDAEKRQHDRMLDDRRIRDSQIRTAFSDGEFKGLAQGKAQGLAQGLTQGLAQGKAERDQLETELQAAQARIAELEKMKNEQI